MVNGMFIINPEDGDQFSDVELAYQKASGLIALSDEDWASVGPGYSYVNGTLVAPPAKTPEEIQTKLNAEKVAVNTAKKAELITVAIDRVSVLQDAVDLEMATDDEIAMLKTWKTYKVLLSRTNTNVQENISWPSAPDQ